MEEFMTTEAVKCCWCDSTDFYKLESSVKDSDGNLVLKYMCRTCTCEFTNRGDPYRGVTTSGQFLDGSPNLGRKDWIAHHFQ